jgi:hypothetical protein
MRGQMTHPDTDVLAEFHAGLVTGRRRRRISAHVTGCDRCAGLGDQLAGVSALLAAVPPPAMPDPVRQRLDAALAAEAEGRAAPGRAGGDAQPGRAPGAQRGRRSVWRLVPVRVLAPAAVLLAAAGFGLSQIGGGTSPVVTGSATAPHALPSPSAASVKGAASRGEANPRLGVGAVNVSVVTASTDYQRATIRQQLETQLRSQAAVPGQPASPQVQGCALGLARGTSGVTAIRVEQAYFQGQAALIIIASSPSAEQVWVTGPSCSAASKDVVYATTLPGISAP